MVVGYVMVVTRGLTLILDSGGGVTAVDLLIRQGGG